MSTDTTSLIRQILEDLDPATFAETQQQDVPLELVPQILEYIGLDSEIFLTRFESTFCLDRCSANVSIDDITRLIQVFQREQASYDQLKTKLLTYSNDHATISAELAQKIITTNTIQLASEEVDELMNDLDPNGTGQVDIDSFVGLLLIHQ